MCSKIYFDLKKKEKVPDDSAVLGAQEVAVPVVISTLTTLVVFIPILFVIGIAGFLFRDLALTISFALSVSSIVALSLIPMMSSQLLTGDTAEGASGSYLKRLLDWSRDSIYKRILVSPLLLIGAVLYPLVWLFKDIGKKTGVFFQESCWACIISYARPCGTAISGTP
ncbi:MAG: efflux RND transporter permease subunit [Balneolaceae bacterium]|nr:efflux RND transporter permease subunit [Balneolaceae bacterium]